ncbi:hypothetical protein P376_0905 [Streptomyces sp. HCCB10043]|nr:hypothetical protein P376_0905 [Streptomyces sp. HCCB10043]
MGVCRLADGARRAGERGAQGTARRPSRPAERAGAVVRPGGSHLVIVPQPRPV